MSSIMADSISTPPSRLLLCPNKTSPSKSFVFDSSLLQDRPNLPEEFLWPEKDLASSHPDELNEPVIDLKGFLQGDKAETAQAAGLIRAACLNHGFFQVTNHGIDSELIEAAYQAVDSIFNLPISRKLSMTRKPGGVNGYSGAHADRYTSKLPWKETFSFGFSGDGDEPAAAVVDYFKSVLGDDFEYSGWVYQRYCEAMKELSLVIMELLGISLGIGRKHYRDFFEDGSSIMRCNLYPPCKNEELTMGTGPHCDPNSLTILHQDQVGGLQVFADNRWQAVRPCQNAFVVNIGDTFMALSNGKYKSCLHRAVVNRDMERRSLVYFVCPREDKVVTPPPGLLSRDGARHYPDFTWSDLLRFTQLHYRADVDTLQSFFKWLPTI